MQVASSHAAALRDAADQLAYLHGELAAGQAPPYDVPTAFHVLRRGGGHLLPTIIEDELGPKPSATGPNDEGTDGASAVQDAALLRRWDFLLRCKLLEEGLPEGVRVESIGGGTVTLYSADGAYYKAHLAIVPAPGKEVTLAKWGDTPSTVQEAGEGEVEQAVPTEPDGGHENAAMDVDGTVEAASNEGAKPSSEAFHWRWRLMSFELLPGLSPPVLSPLLAQWLQRNVEDRMWAAGDIQQLTSLGKAHLVIVPPAPLSKEERDRRQAERDEIKKGLGPKDRSKLTGAGTSAARTSSAAGGGGVSSGPGPSSAGGPPGSSSLAPGSNGTDMPVPGDIPAWAASPLAAMHAVLLNAASKLAVGQLLLEEARGMEEGSWAGHLRASRAPQGAGLR